jgi:hypothetical protein
MQRKVVMTLAGVAFLASSNYALAEHEFEFSFPWEETQTMKGHKVEGKKGEHWGKHHHQGVYLEGSDYEHNHVPQYD